MGLQREMQMEVIWCDPGVRIALHSSANRGCTGELRGSESLQALTLRQGAQLLKCV